MDRQLQQLPGVVLGAICGVTDDGWPIVCTDGGAAVTALCATTPRDWRAAVGQRAVVAFVDSDPARPVVLGVIGPAVAAALVATPRTLRVSAGEELLIECGKSKIHLRADGRIEIRGEHLVSRSRGPNKIKGGSVHLN